MQFILMLYSDEAGWPALTAAQQGEAMAAYRAYTEALEEANALRAVGRLQPTASAATVRVTDGRPEVLDGPYADSKEQLGGYYVIDVADREAALSWAARCPGASHGAVEVRPLST